MEDMVNEKILEGMDLGEDFPKDTEKITDSSLRVNDKESPNYVETVNLGGNSQTPNAKNKEVLPPYKNPVTKSTFTNSKKSSQNHSNSSQPRSLTL